LLLAFAEHAWKATLPFVVCLGIPSVESYFTNCCHLGRRTSSIS